MAHLLLLLLQTLLLRWSMSSDVSSAGVSAPALKSREYGPLCVVKMSCIDGYNRLSLAYDSAINITVAFDDHILSAIYTDDLVDMRSRCTAAEVTILDAGCGTGRHLSRVF